MTDDAAHEVAESALVTPSPGIELLNWGPRETRPELGLVDGSQEIVT